MPWRHSDNGVGTVDDLRLTCRRVLSDEKFGQVAHTLLVRWCHTAVTLCG